MISIGSLRRRALLQQRGVAADTFGQQTTTWTTLFPIWCEIQALSGQALYSAQAVQTEISHTVTVRYRAEFADPKVVATYRVLYNGRCFDIKAMMNVTERDRVVTLMAAEGLEQG